MTAWPDDDVPRESASMFEEVELGDGAVMLYRRHTNGGGRVALDAQAHSTAYIADSTWVDSGAAVRAGARLGPHSWVERDAQVEAEVTIGEHAHVGAGAVIGAGSRLGSRARVGAGVQLAAGTVVAPEARVERRALARRRPVSSPTQGVTDRVSRART